MKRVPIDFYAIANDKRASKKSFINKFIRYWGTTFVDGVEVFADKHYFYRHKHGKKDWVKVLRKEVTGYKTIPAGDLLPERKEPIYKTIYDYEFTPAVDGGRPKLFKFLGAYEQLANSSTKGVKDLWLFLNSDKIPVDISTTNIDLLSKINSYLESMMEPKFLGYYIKDSTGKDVPAISEPRAEFNSVLSITETPVQYDGDILAYRPYKSNFKLPTLKGLTNEEVKQWLLDNYATFEQSCAITSSFIKDSGYRVALSGLDNKAFTITTKVGNGSKFDTYSVNIPAMSMTQLEAYIDNIALTVFNNEIACSSSDTYLKFTAISPDEILKDFKIIIDGVDAVVEQITKTNQLIPAVTILAPSLSEVSFEVVSFTYKPLRYSAIDNTQSPPSLDIELSITINSLFKSSDKIITYITDLVKKINTPEYDCSGEGCTADLSVINWKASIEGVNGINLYKALGLDSTYANRNHELFYYKKNSRGYYTGVHYLRVEPFRKSGYFSIRDVNGKRLRNEDGTLSTEDDLKIRILQKIIDSGYNENDCDVMCSIGKTAVVVVAVVAAAYLGPIMGQYIGGAALTAGANIATAATIATVATIAAYVVIVYSTLQIAAAVSSALGNDSLAREVANLAATIAPMAMVAQLALLVLSVGNSINGALSSLETGVPGSVAYRVVEAEYGAEATAMMSSEEIALRASTMDTTAYIKNIITDVIPDMTVDKISSMFTADIRGLNNVLKMVNTGLNMYQEDQLNTMQSKTKSLENKTAELKQGLEDNRQKDLTMAFATQAWSPLDSDWNSIYNYETMYGPSFNNVQRCEITALMKGGADTYFNYSLYRYG